MRPNPNPVKFDVGKSRVLVVDDSAVARQLLRTILEVLDIVIVEAADGAAALTALSAHDYDVVVTDLEMSPRNGFDLINGLAALPGGRRRPRVIVCSALVGTYAIADRRELLEAVALLPKPVRADELLGEVIKVLNED